MYFSLIIGTLNRCTELEICLDSLNKQLFRDFEVIIVDQSKDKKAHDLIEKYDGLNIKYYNVEFHGLSKARNFALARSEGKYFALVDDDASYSEDYLLNAKTRLEKYENVILSGSMLDSSGTTYINYRQKEKVLTIRDIIRYTPSPGLIFPLCLFRQGILFDEMFGVGARFGACEETDYILNAIDRGYKVIYVDNMRYVHPTVEHTFEIENDTRIKKIENYAKGLGALFLKDKLQRRSNRLSFIALEKFLRIIVKYTGIMGTKKKLEADAEMKGLKYGLNEYAKLPKI